jgi:hypothetical protein
VLDALGGASVNVTGWHGEAHDWRELYGRDVGTERRSLVHDGRHRRFEHERMRIMIRAWTLQLEGGPAMQLELHTALQRGRRNRMNTLLRQARGEADERLEDMNLDTLLEVGFAYVLTGESPDVVWEFARTDIAPGQEPAVDQDDTPDGAERPSGRTVGPGASAAMSVGEYLFQVEAGSIGREIIVFVPRIPQAMIPGVDAAEPDSHDG